MQHYAYAAYIFVGFERFCTQNIYALAHIGVNDPRIFLQRDATLIFTDFFFTNDTSQYAFTCSLFPHSHGDAHCRAVRSV